MKILGINDDVTTCECCGRAGLKKTVVLESFDGLQRVHFGSQCAAKAIGKRKSTVDREASLYQSVLDKIRSYELEIVSVDTIQSVLKQYGLPTNMTASVAMDI